MLQEFWSTATPHGLHPCDKGHVDMANCLDWSLEDAEQQQDRFKHDKILPKKIHINLCPQPFVGNINSASVYILHANPGYDISDYRDEMSDANGHAKACADNLRQTGRGFFPLLEESSGTGAAFYWERGLRTLIDELACQLDNDIGQARSILIRKLCIIEACAYHSGKFPGDWHERLPSSEIARKWVKETLVPRALAGHALIFTWRRASFWGVQDAAPFIISRPSKNARGRYIWPKSVAKSFAFCSNVHRTSLEWK